MSVGFRAIAFGLACFAALAVLCTIGGAPGAAKADDPPALSRGEYLARAGDCVACHTSPEGKPFVGGAYMPTPFGQISVPNITPDKKTGIGDWTDDQFYRALHEGIGHSGAYLYPVFPFPWYTNVTREDALAIKAYLFSLPPADAPRKPLKMGFPFNVREALLTWRTLFFTPGKTNPPSLGDPKLERGRYLVEGLGHCGECHNRHDVLGASNWSGRLEGGQIEGWYAPNITGDVSQGVGSWSEDDLATFLKTGSAPGRGVVLGPMQETINDSLRYLTDEDLHAIAAYLKSTSAKETHANENPAADAAAVKPDAQAYLTHCSYCHQLNGQGIKGAIPALAGNGAVTAEGPENVLRVVLGGLPASHGLAPMPAVGAGMTDREVAEAVDYVRNNWGNAAPGAVDPGSIDGLRQQTQTLLAGNLPGACEKAAESPTGKIVEASAGDALKGVRPGDMVDAIDRALAKVKASGPQLSVDDVVNGLTATYCRAALSDPKLSPKQRAIDIGNFSMLVYTEMVSPERGP